MSRRIVKHPGKKLDPKDLRVLKGSRWAAANRSRYEIESLEDRLVMAGPQLVEIFLNDLSSVAAGSIVNSPNQVLGSATYTDQIREILFQFNAPTPSAAAINPNAINPATVPDAVQIYSPGANGVFEAIGAAGSDDVRVGGINIIGQLPNEILFRSTDTLPEGSYQLRIMGAGASALRNNAGEAFNNGVNFTRNFSVDLPPRVAAVVPQPIVRTGSTLSQLTNVVDVYFDQAMGASAVDTSNYKIINTQGSLNPNDDAFIAIQSAAFVDGSGNRTVRLTTSAPIPEGTFRLRIGNDDFVPSAVTPALNGPTVISEYVESLTSLNTFALADLLANRLPSLNSTASRSIVVNGQILDVRNYPLQFPGTNDEPGHRAIPVDSENHISSQGDTGAGIPVVQYNFSSFYGFDPQGKPLFNLITETQKQRAREVFELYSRYLGVQFVETAASGIQIVTGDPRAVDPNVTANVGGIGGGNIALMNALVDWGASEFGGGWFLTAFHEIGHALGLEHDYELPPITIMGAGGGETVTGVFAEPVFPGDADIIHGQILYRPESRDIDIFRFDLTTGGVLNAQTIAERLTPQSSALNTVLTIYDANYNIVARNDDYFGMDSFVQVSLAAGTYYAAISSTGNSDYDPRIQDSGLGGTTQGTYQLRLDFEQQSNKSILDATGLALDGDFDNRPGGEYNFWFESGSTIFVDKLADVTSGVDGAGTLASPYDNIATAITAAQNRIVVPSINGGNLRDGDTFVVSDGIGAPITFEFNSVGGVRAGNVGIAFSAGQASTAIAENIRAAIGSQPRLTASRVGSIVNIGGAARIDLTGSQALLKAPNLVRIVANGGTDGNVNTIADNRPYLVGAGLADGANLIAPQGVTVMIDAGALIKLNAANIDIGLSTQGVDRSGAALQVLGTPTLSVTFTSLFDGTRGGVTGGANRVVGGAGDWGGLVFRDKSDLEKDGIFLNAVLGAKIYFAGGNVVTDGLLTPYEAITIDAARPQIGYTLIQTSQAAAMSADPDSFIESNYNTRSDQVIDYTRVGPSIHNNKLFGNSINGLLIKVRTPLASALEPLRGIARFDDTDIVHVLSDNLVLKGAPGGAIALSRQAVARYAAGNYIVLDTLASSIDDDYVGQQIQILSGPGANQTRTIVRYDGLTRTAYLDSDWTTLPTSQSTFQISGTVARPNAQLNIDGGVIIKSLGSRIEVQMGAQLLAEGTPGRPVIFTSLTDDSYAAGGTFDTNNNGVSAGAPGNWSGIYFAPVSRGSLDNVRITFGGGFSDIEGNSDRFNALEIYQAVVRVANSLVQFNAGGQSTTTRNGRQANAPAAIFVRGAQPTLINSIIRDNLGAAITVNANAMNSVVAGDAGRQTGLLKDFGQFDDNYGPLVRLNVLSNNVVNGLVVRGATLTTETVWDDTDIVHVLFDEIEVLNHHTYSGLRLQSRPGQSLVVKLQTRPELAPAVAGFTANGVPLDIDDRIGGTIQIIGAPQNPVVLTSFLDDTVGAGVNLLGQTNVDTDNVALTPKAGDWRSIRFDVYSNDRNVRTVLESEAAYTAGNDRNATPGTAEIIGSLARNEQSGDDNLRLGFQIKGAIAYDDPTDVDVYRFSGVAGTEVWLDIDRTRSALDLIVELVDSNGTVIARSVGLDPTTNQMIMQNVGLPQTDGPLDNGPLALQKDPYLGGDFFSTNTRDPGMRLILPGQNGQRRDYFVRVRSNPINQPIDPASNAPIENLDGGLSRGDYELNIRLRQTDEKPGSTVRYADIRYATNGVEVIGMPGHSPLLGDTGETRAPNEVAAFAQDMGNLLTSDRNTITVGGIISNPADIDWYKFTVQYDLIQAIAGFNDGGKIWSTIFDIDYTDGAARADLTLSVFDEFGNLILVSRDSNVDDDQNRNFNGVNTSLSTTDVLNRGSYSALDPYIGPVGLPEGSRTVEGQSVPRTYYVAISSNAALPQVLDAYFKFEATDPLLRLEPVNSINRVIEDHIGFLGYSSLSLAGSGGSTTPSTSAAAQNPLFGTPGADPDLSPLTIAANAVPFTLADLNLFVYGFRAISPDDSIGSLWSVNPFTGAFRTLVGNPTGVDGVGYADIAMRPDGALYGLTTDFSTADESGNYRRFNLGDGTEENRGDDGLSNQPDTPTPIVFSYPAMAYRGEPGDFDYRGLTLWAVNQNNLVFRLNPLTGTWLNPLGSGPPSSAGQLGAPQYVFTGGLTAGANLPDGARVIMIDAAGVPQVFEFDSPLTFTVDGPLTNNDVLVIRETGTGQATDYSFFLDTDGGTPPPGYNAANQNHRLVDLQGATTNAARATVIAAFVNSAIGGTTAIGNTIFVPPPGQAGGIRSVVTAGIPTPPPANITLVRNSAGVQLNSVAVRYTINSTEFDLAQAFAAAVNSGSTQSTLQASISGTTVQITGSSFTGQPANAANLIALQQSTTVGTAQGAAFLGDRFFVGTSSNRLLEVDESSAIVLVNQQMNLTVNGSVYTVRGMTPGPSAVQGGAYANMIFVVATGFDPDPAINNTSTRLFAFNPNFDPIQGGALDPLPIFASGATSVRLALPTDLDPRTADQFVRSFVTGLAFSTSDVNLWHPTKTRGDDPGHGINQAFDQSRVFLPNDQRNGGVSYAFGVDSNVASPYVGQARTNPYQFRTADGLSEILGTYDVPGGTQGSLVTNSFSLQGYSALDKPTLYFNYFLDSQGAKSNDPTKDTMRDSFRVFISDDGVNWEQLVTNNSTKSLFFGANSSLGELGEVERASGGSYIPQANLSAAQQAQQRVQEAYDNSSPAGTAEDEFWRQVRVDLGDFAGKANLRLRFDFSTAGTMNEGSKIAAVAGSQIADGSSFTLTDPTLGAMTFEFDKPATAPVVAPNVKLLATGARSIRDGESVIVRGATGDTVYEFNTGPVLTQFFSPQNGATFSITNSAGVTRVFEYDTDASLPIGNTNVRIGFIVDQDLATIAQSVINAINGANFGVTASLGSSGRITLTGDSTTTPPAIDTTPGFTTGLFVTGDFVRNTPAGPTVVLVNIEETFTQLQLATALTAAINTSGTGVTATATPTGNEITLNGGTFTAVNSFFSPAIVLGRQAVSITNADSAADVATKIAAAINAVPSLASHANAIGYQGTVNGSLAGVYTTSNANIVQIYAQVPGGDKALIDVSVEISATANSGLAVSQGLIGDEFGAWLSNQRGQKNDYEGVYIDDIIIGFAERGEMVTYSSSTPTPNTNFFAVPRSPNPLTPSEVLIGPYQLEIRRGETYSGPLRANSSFVGLNRSFDTNDRQAHGFSFYTPSGSTAGLDNTVVTVNDGYRSVTFQFETGATLNLPTNGGLSLRDGDAVTVSNGLTQLSFELRSGLVLLVSNLGGAAISDGNTFTIVDQAGLPTVYEFDSNNTVTPGRIRVGFTAADSAATIASAIVTAINTQGAILSGARAGLGQPANAGDPQRISISGEQIVTESSPGLSLFGSLIPTPGAIVIPFEETDSTLAIAAKIVAAVNNSGLGVIASYRENRVGFIGGDITSVFSQINGALANGGGSGGVAADIGIPVLMSDTAEDVADKLASAISTATARGFRLDVRAYTSNLADSLSVSLPTPNSNRVNLVNATGATVTGGVVTVTEYGATNGDGTFTHQGDTNLFRDQGQFIVESSRITQAAAVGVVVDAGAREASDSLSFPGAPRNFPVLNQTRITRGAVLSNLIIDNFGTAGIVFSGDPNLGDSPLAAVPFGRIINSTIYGGATAKGIGIQVTENASPTIINTIIANTALGVSVDASSSSTVLNSLVFQGNTQNTDTGGIGALSYVQPANQPLFVNAAAGNFYLAPGTLAQPNLAVDSANNAMDDRPNIAAVLDGIFLGPSPILAPDTDMRGQRRSDNPAAQTPPGLGENVFKDRGALEQVDFTGPTTSLVDPLDGGPDDQNSAPHVVRLDTAARPTVSSFAFQLGDGTNGVGIDDLTVTASRISLRRNGVLLVQGTDYVFQYDANSKSVRLTAVSGRFESGTYVISIDNTATGVKDLAGNPLQGNQSDGTAKLTIEYVNAPSPATVSSVQVVNYGLSQYGGTTRLNATVTGTPNESLSVFFVALQQATDPLNAGRSLGAVVVTTDVSGVAAVTLNFNSSVNGEYIAWRIQDSLGNDVTASYTPTVIGPNTTARRAFVSSVYNDLLKRDATLSEMVALETSGQTPLQIVTALVASVEFDQMSVRSIYQALLGREPTTAQLNSGVSLLQSGQPNNALRQQILLSDEFRTNQGGGLNNTSGYVTAVYQKLLGRAPTTNELSDGVFRIGEFGRTSYVQSMLSLQEFRVRQVNGWFSGPGESSLAPANLLGRAPTTAELNAMTAALAGNANEDQIIAQIMGSVGTANGSEYYFIRLVRSAFRDYLKRDVTTNGTTFWVNKLLSGANNESSFRASLLASDEFFINNGSDNTRFVQDVFRKLLGREVKTSSPNELAAALTLITQPGGSRTAMVNSILVTPGPLNTEYLARTSGATASASASTADFSKVQGLAEYVLGRPLTPVDTVNTAFSLQGGMSTNAALASILGGAEYYAKQGGTPTGFVTGLYKQLLGSVTPSISVSAAVAQLQSGMTREQFALNFLNGPDFAKVLGFQGWASSMVSDLLKRPAGYGDWLPYAQQAAAGASLADVATTFLNSVAYRTVVIQTAFQDIVKREVKASGLNFWLSAFAAGQTERDLIIALMTSAEYYTLVGGTNTAFVKSAFLYLVGRNPADSGLNFWLTQLSSGQSRTSLVTGLLDSAEYVGRKINLAVTSLAPGSVDTATQTQWTNQIRGGQLTYTRMYANVLSGSGYVAKTTSASTTATASSRPMAAAAIDEWWSEHDLASFYFR